MIEGRKKAASSSNTAPTEREATENTLRGYAGRGKDRDHPARSRPPGRRRRVVDTVLVDIAWRPGRLSGGWS
jgi:hypothetical protein